MTNHPEQREDEVFLGNVPTNRGARECFGNLKSLRLGNQAYDVYGKEKISQDYMRPSFIGKHEEENYNRIYMAEMRVSERIKSWK
jgi:hypothetical protein